MLQTGGVDVELPPTTASAELLNQYRAWFRLGGTTNHLGYPVRWLLGDAESGRWVEFVDDAKDLLWHESMPQPTSFKTFRIDALSTRHGIPSCAWQISRKERRGSFNRHKASLAGLGNEEKKRLSEGFDIELELSLIHI